LPAALREDRVDYYILILLSARFVAS
jgi:hypothetical protein